MSCKTAQYDVKFSDTSDYTLTTSFVASDAIPLDYASKLFIYPFYTAGAATTTNTLHFTVEVNPYNAEEDSAGAYWTELGNWVNSTGTYAEEGAEYVSGAGTAATLVAITPLKIDQFNAQQIRLKVKETQNQAVAGTARFVLGVSNDD